MALIEQQKALDAIEKCHKRCCRTDSNGDEWIHYETTLNEIESIKPTQEIIHCKDCKFAHMTVNGECKYCDIWFPDEKTYMPGDYYCASAERRDEAE